MFIIFRLSLTAITKVDLSNNRLSVMPTILFQLQSLKILTMDHNCIAKIDLPLFDFKSPYLEVISFIGNYIDELPSQVNLIIFLLFF